MRCRERWTTSRSSAGGGGWFNQFFVMDNDEAATIENFDADGTQGLTCTANHCGSYVYARELRVRR